MSEIVKLTHAFINKLPDVDELFATHNDEGHVVTIESFCRRATILANKYALLLRPEDFKGWSLELLAEFLIKAEGHDNRIGIYDYSVIGDIEEDRGVDGVGIGENKYPAAVQVKFRTGDYILTDGEDNLIRFVHIARKNHGVRFEDEKNLLIITTGKEVHSNTREDLGDGVRVLNRAALREMLDNRPEWWNRFWDSVKASRTSITEIPKIELRLHQKEAVEASIKDTDGKGKFILPTGSGKTNIEAEIARLEIEALLAKGITPIVKVNTSRILLCFQLFEEFFKYFAPYKIDAKYVNFNSGNADDKYFAQEIRKIGGIFRAIDSYTSPKMVKAVYERCQKEHLPLVIFSTYHSSEKFAESELKPHLTIHDESHNLVSKEFSNVAILPSDKDYFFTATTRVTDSGLDLGMNNETRFGNLIYSKSAREMIEIGEMVPPFIHIVKAKNVINVDVEKVDTDYESLFNSIVESFLAHEKVVRQECLLGYQDSIGGKILVVCRGQQDLIEMFKTKAFEAFRLANPTVNIMALSSEFGLRINDEYFTPPVTNSKKYKLLKMMKNLPSSARCIIFHVDMIGEGIDVPGITGVMPFRNCEMVKFIQNVGRSSRLHRVDRQRLYSGEINISDRSKWIKPKSWIIIPSFMANSEGFVDRFRKILWDLRTEFGFIPEQHTVIDNGKGFEEDDDIDKVNDQTKVKKHTASGIDGFEHEFEETTFLEKLLFEHKMATEVKKALDTISEGIAATNVVSEFMTKMGIQSEF